MSFFALSSRGPGDVLRLSPVNALSTSLDELERPRSLKQPVQEPAQGEIQEWMERYVDGDVEAFEQLFHRVAPKLYSYLLRLTRNRERAEDLVQVTFAKVHRARASYLRGAPVLPWVLAIARRSFYDERRRAKARHEDLTFDGVVPEPRPNGDHLSNDMAESLERALARLPDNYREAIELTKFMGLSIAETVHVLGTTETAVKLRVHRGYNQLRTELERFRRGTP